MNRRVKKSVGSNAILNIIKQSCNIIFPLVSYPYVTRVLGEQSLGKFSFADSIITYFLIFASLGIPTYAIREGARLRDDSKAMLTFSSELFTINLITTAISYLLLFGVYCNQVRLQKEPILLLILSVNIITNTLSRDWINSVYEDFFYITIRYIVFQVISLVLIFVFVKDSKAYIIYTAIMMFSNSGAYLSSFVYTIKHVPIRLTRKLNIKKHIKPILYLFCSTLAIQIYVKSDITVLGYLRSDSEVGIYTAASKIYTIVKALLNAIITVAIPRLSYYLGANNKDEYNRLLKLLRDGLVALIIPCVVGILCLSEEVIVLIGGRTYITGAVPLSILCFALIFSVFGCYYTQGILIVNRDEKTFMIATVISALLNVILNIILVPVIGMRGAALTTVIAEALICIICYFKAFQYYEKTVYKGIIPVIIGCLSIVGICYLFKSLIGNTIIRLFLCIVLSVGSYFLILLIGNNEFLWYAIRKFFKRNQKN